MMDYFKFMVGITRASAVIHNYDRNQIAGQEHVMCSDCFRRTLPTVYGKCGCCGSAAVASEAMIGVRRA
jgi:hypothetical protein